MSKPSNKPREYQYLSEIINDVDVGLHFLGCVNPSKNVEEFWIQKISPEKRYIILHSEMLQKEFWVDIRNVALFEII